MNDEHQKSLHAIIAGEGLPKDMMLLLPNDNPKGLTLEQMAAQGEAVIARLNPPTPPAKRLIVDDYTSKAREAFLELETILQSHRASNVIPTLAASDIHDAATNLFNAVLGLKRHDALDPVPAIED